MHSVFPTQSANEQRFASLTRWTHTVRIKPYNANVDDTSNFDQFVLYICSHAFLKEKMCPKFMITLYV